MAETVLGMPSVDEDFDAVLAPVRPRKPRTKKPKPIQPESEAEAEVIPEPKRSVPVAVVDVAEEIPADIPPETPAPDPYIYKNVETTPESYVVSDQSEYVPEYVEPLNQPEKPVDASTADRKTKLNFRQGSHLIIEIVLLIALVGLGLWTWQLYTDRQALRSQVSSYRADPQIIARQQSADLITQVGKLISLPSNETPTIANVSDAVQARQQSTFFNNAQNGDKVLMYVKAGEAILYRPSTNKIILVAPLTFNGTNNADTQKP